jgi:predicted phosphodiesterase
MQSEKTKTRFLAISDLHGSMETMEMLHQRLQAIHAMYDFVIFAGDFSNFIFEGLETVKVFPLVIQQFERLAAPVYFIRGNRDQNLQLRRVLPVAFKNGISIEDRVETIAGTPIKIAGHLAKELHTLPIDDQTILVTHDEPKTLHARPMLHVAGHTHASRVIDGFLNSGFLHRTPDHGTKAMNGIFWLGEIEIVSGKPVLGSLNWHALEGKDDEVPGSKRRFPFKEYICPRHASAGTWILPFYWKQCLLCYK